LIYFILGWFPLLAPAVLAIRDAIQRRDAKLLAPSLWVILVFPLLYLPINTPRRFSLALQLPLAVLAVDWFGRVALPMLRRRFFRRWRTLALGYLALSCLSTLAVWITWIGAASRPLAHYTATQQAGYDWVKANTNPDAVFLVNGEVEDNAAIVGVTGRRVVLGHWAETANFMQKQDEAARFFDPLTSASWRQVWLTAQHIDYLWIDANLPTGAWTPAGLDCVRPVFTRETLTIYQATCAIPSANGGGSSSVLVFP
jgi:hypothetical protein